MRLKLYLTLFVVLACFGTTTAQSASINGDFETFTDLTPVYNEIFETNYPAGTSVAPEGYQSITRLSLLIFQYVLFGTLPVGDELDQLFEGASGLAEVDGGANGSAKSVALTGDDFFAGADLFGAFPAETVGSTFSGYYRFEGQDNGEDTLLVMCIYDANTFLPDDISGLPATSAYSLDTLYPNGSADFTYFESTINVNPNGGATDTVNIFLLAFLDSTAIANGANNRFIVDQLGFDQDPASTCDQDGGQLTFADGSESTTICAGDGVADPLVVTLTDAVADNTAWVITDDAGVILELPMAPPFDLDGAPDGTCLIWHLAFEDGLTGADIGANAMDLMGCFDLSNPLTVVRNRPAGGTLSLLAGGDMTSICVADAIPDTVTLALVDAVGVNSSYVVTDENAVIIELVDNPEIVINSMMAGTLLLWHISFEDNLQGATVGSSANDLTGCFNLSNPVTVTLEVDGPTCISSNNETTIASDLVQVYPNPAHDVVTIACKEEVGKLSNVQLISLDGREITAPLSYSAESTIKVDVSQVATGVYILSITTESGLIHKTMQVR